VHGEKMDQAINDAGKFINYMEEGNLFSFNTFNQNIFQVAPNKI
jgi:hypothetical protein